MVWLTELVNKIFLNKPKKEVLELGKQLLKKKIIVKFKKNFTC